MSSSAVAVNYPGEHSGLTNAKLGIWLFLASEVMLFATLFTSYLVIRLGSSSWPRGWEVLNVPLGTINTFVLITSSVTIILAYAKCMARDKAGFKTYMALTLALAFVFLGIKSVEWGTKFRAHHFPSTNIFFGVYFVLTGLHALHVIGGIILNSVLLFMADKHWDDPLFAGRVEAAGLYWHFVDIVWIFLLPALYLL